MIIPQNSFKLNSLNTYVAATRLITNINRVITGKSQGGVVKVRCSRGSLNCLAMVGKKFGISLIAYSSL